MADSKVSELTAATSVAAADTLYLVQSSTSKRVTTANLFANVATPVSFSDKINIAGTAQSLTGAGTISTSTTVTTLSPGSSGTLDIGSGTEGQIKIIIMIANSSAYVLTLEDSQLGHTSVRFDAVGETATLIYTNSKWYCIGGTATVS
jgi:hypothetical protein